VHFGVDLIVRGKDLYPSTLAQLDLARILEKPQFSTSTFFHHELIKGPKQTKLSKSAGDTSIQFLRKEGKKLGDVFRILGKMIGKEDEIHSIQDFSRLIP
jgi:glutamyl-tRNA synthetase